MNKVLIKTSLHSVLALTLLLLMSSMAVNAQDRDYEDRSDKKDYKSDKSVVEVINESEDHTILSELLAEAQLIETLNQPGPYTVLAPTDEAFNLLGANLQQLREDPQQLQNVLLNHLFQGEVPSDQINEAMGLDIEKGDIDADNGVVHVIDIVITEN